MFLCVCVCGGVFGGEGDLPDGVSKPVEVCLFFPYVCGMGRGECLACHKREAAGRRIDQQSHPILQPQRRKERAHDDMTERAWPGCILALALAFALCFRRYFLRGLSHTRLVLVYIYTQQHLPSQFISCSGAGSHSRRRRGAISFHCHFPLRRGATPVHAIVTITIVAVTFFTVHLARAKPPKHGRIHSQALQNTRAFLLLRPPSFLQPAS
jgi:hypothetical protein